MDADFLVGMQKFREWAVMVVSEGHDPDLVIPEPAGKRQEFAFSLDAYNRFVSRSNIGLKAMKDADELHSLLKRHAKHLYDGEFAIRIEDTDFFILPNAIQEFNFKRNK